MRETVFLNNDREMPLLGLGVYKLPDDVQAEAAVISAIFSNLIFVIFLSPALNHIVSPFLE